VLSGANQATAIYAVEMSVELARSCGDKNPFVRIRCQNSRVDCRHDRYATCERARRFRKFGSNNLLLGACSPCFRIHGTLSRCVILKMRGRSALSAGGMALLGS
jgi:hypothetical protein